MKKQLLAGAFVLASFLTAQAQELSFNFDNLNVGNLGTDATGQTLGQGDWGTFATNGAAGTTTTNMGNESLQVVVNATQGNVLQLVGPNGNSGVGVAFRPGSEIFTDFWDTRTEGNDIFQTEFLFYTGTLGTSLNSFEVSAVSALSATDVRTIGGLAFDASTFEITGIKYIEPTGQPAGNYLFSLGTEETPSVILPQNTWVRIGFSYDSTTGITIWRGVNDAAQEILFDGDSSNADGGDLLEPVEVDFSVFSGSTEDTDNDASATALFDNILINLSSTDTLLAGETAGVKDNVIVSLAVTPNPANDVVNITNNENALLNGVVVTDLNGRTVKTAKFAGVAQAQVNVSDLASGVYMMTISSDKGSVTKKIVKN